MRKITESQITKPDVKAVFRTAVNARKTPTGVGRFIKSLRKPEIDLAELQRAWADDGYPDDTQDINALLLAHGFSKPEIKKIFVKVFGEDPDSEEGYEDPAEGSPSIMKLAEYVKKHGIEAEVIAFLQKEYGFTESQMFSGKLVVEDIREIFTAIVHENRSGRAELVRDYENTQLGRSKK